MNQRDGSMIRQGCPVMINNKLMLVDSDKALVGLRDSMSNSEEHPEVVVDSSVKVIHLVTFSKNSRNSLEVPVLVASNVALSAVQRQQRDKTLL